MPQRSISALASNYYESVDDPVQTDSAIVSQSDGLSSRLHTKRMRTDHSEKQTKFTPMDRMQHARDGLAILDKKGWNRSFHQRLFHEDFLVRCVKVFPQKTGPVSGFQICP